jgi:hypothetical protein
MVRRGMMSDQKELCIRKSFTGIRDYIHQMETSKERKKRKGSRIEQGASAVDCVSALGRAIHGQNNSYLCELADDFCALL